MTALSEKGLRAEIEIARQLDGTFRLVTYENGSPTYRTVLVPYDFIPKHNGGYHK